MPFFLAQSSRYSDSSFGKLIFKLRLLLLSLLSILCSNIYTCIHYIHLELRMPAKPTFEKHTLIELLLKFEGDIKQCRKALGTKSSQTIYSCIDRNPEIKAIWLKIQEK